VLWQSAEPDRHFEERRLADAIATAGTAHPVPGAGGDDSVALQIEDLLSGSPLHGGAMITALTSISRRYACPRDALSRRWA
jgi:hypothetical protein